MATIDQTIKEIEEKLKQAKAKKQKMESSKRAAETKIQRANDTRRKILVGAFVLAHCPYPRNLGIGGNFFRETLTRDDDKALFDIAPKSAPRVVETADETETRVDKSIAQSEVNLQLADSIKSS